ncbi:cell division protein ZapA [Vagococcus xieshaowenii]|uniref:Cell division protein ZapA n=1 Tax=Vagococcus xieshaowenii TaxID=2562451 RepID=A0AAJ5JL31_9ENTE|nr:cell division protein ZapA [Vagococcus xieshaowenii]QCA29011.1 cell division protein ZapA [Vagococcus xieshaowenii]TFZ41014.1 cell division protein ZapA [Vagococcus xieshaowenii]
MNKTRYKAEINGEYYTIVGTETKAHMDAVVGLANYQMKQILEHSPDTSLDKAAILLAINVLSDQLHLQEKCNNLATEMTNLTQNKECMKDLEEALEQIDELERRLARFEIYDKKARDIVASENLTYEDLSLAEIQELINKHNLEKIQQESEWD